MDRDERNMYPPHTQIGRRRLHDKAQKAASSAVFRIDDKRLRPRLQFKVDLLLC